MLETGILSSKYYFSERWCRALRARNLYVNEGQWLSECRVSLAERKKDVWPSRKTAVLEGIVMYS